MENLSRAFHNRSLYAIKKYTIYFFSGQERMAQTLKCIQRVNGVNPYLIWLTKGHFLNLRFPKYRVAAILNYSISVVQQYISSRGCEQYRGNGFKRDCYLIYKISTRIYIALILCSSYVVCRFIYDILSK